MYHELKQRELIIDLATGNFQINPVTHHTGEIEAGNSIDIIGLVDYGWVKFSQEAQKNKGIPNLITWGGGPLAGPRIPGTHRLVYCGYSPDDWAGPQAIPDQVTPHQSAITGKL